jgi:L-lysine exporter family protein LysE/ArgO
MFPAALTGFGTGLSLILAIGAQNAFVLRQGLIGQHVFWLCLLCAASDAVLIALGVAGFGAVSTLAPWLPRAMMLAGAAFLLVYGALRMRAAIAGGAVIEGAPSGGSLGRTLGVAAALTWLNPHVYLDTLALIGAVSARWAVPAEKFAFGLGAVTSSFVFFFGLGYGARLLAPLMKSATAWRRLDAAIALLMWAIAAGLLQAAL